ncbi:MAG TPA: BREX-6 system adenine-specific DNA-methyltransferase PglX [Kofleriaceae bacterium]|nr:BREX-6 system adenine-specific DNA-methyltransferase PglX [Kofleriaceae bacterium]
MAARANPGSDPFSSLRGVVEIDDDRLAVVAGADHLGSLLKIDVAIDGALAAWDDKLSSANGDQGSLFTGFGKKRRKRITGEHAKATLLDQLEKFLAHHSRGIDLGLRLRGEQLAAGVRFMRMVREGQYDLVVGNPPYQGTGKLADKRYVEVNYSRGKADLYAAFIERGLQLVRTGGTSALLTMRNWMFLTQFSVLRQWILDNHDIRIIGDVDRGAFEGIPDEVVATTISVVRRSKPNSHISIAIQPTPLADTSRDAGRTARKRAALLSQVGRFEFASNRFKAIDTSPLIYWWSPEEIEAYRSAPKLGDIAPVQQGMKTSDNVRFLLRPWEVDRAVLDPAGSSPHLSVWAPCVRGAIGKTWFEPLDYVLRWRNFGLEIKALNEHLWGTYTRNITSEEFYFRRGVAFSMIGKDFRVRAHRFPSVFLDKGSSIFADDVETLLCALNSSAVRNQLSALNPSISFQVGDVRRVALPTIKHTKRIITHLERSFAQHESAREPSFEFRQPGPSSWIFAQQWAQAAIDGVGLPIGDVVLDFAAEAPTDHLSFAIGVALGRFGASGQGILTAASASGLPHGILYLSEASDHDSITHPAAKPIVAAWEQRGIEIDPSRSLKDYLRDRFFSDVHRKMYENRPIYFPLSSAKRSFVAFVSIHRWTDKTLTNLLAEHLLPERKRLLGQKTDLANARDGADKKAARAAEKQLDSLVAWLDELDDFIAKVEQQSHKGPPPTDTKTNAREVDAPFAMNLDDGVMINSAALWPLLEPQWKDPRKWWKELANAEGKKDYDWAQVASRYFPGRVDSKCKTDPSLAVAHQCFWKYHPAKAYQWELRLQDEIRPDFTIDEPGSDAARKAFLANNADLARELVAKESLRRDRKRSKAAGHREMNSSDVQTDLGLDDDEDGSEELSV